MSKFSYQLKVLNNKICRLRNSLSTYVQDIINLNLLGTDLILTYLDQNGEEQTQVADLSSLGGGVPVYGTELNLFESNSVSTDDTTNLIDKINDNTSNLPIGTYRLRVSYSWNFASTSNDFESYLFFDGSAIGPDASGLIHKQEPKDSAGNWNGTGSAQRFSFSKDYYINIVVSGIRSVLLQFRTDNVGTNASIWDANIQLIRIS